jgi:CDGSH-type Zn-finger protein
VDDNVLKAIEENNMAERAMPQKGPYPVDVEAGKSYLWCACGHSANQPFCDGSHHGTGFTPVKFVAKDSEAAWLCGCKRTRNKPFCDGTHEKL